MHFSMRQMLVVAAWLAALGAVGCGGSNNNNGVPTIPCTLPSGTSVALIYPIPNATRVPDTLSSVILALNSPLPANWEIVLGSSAATYYGQSLLTGTPNPLPSPRAATPVGTTLQYSTFIGTGGLVSQTTYAVALNNTNANCNSFPTVGSFTSQ